MKPIFNYGDVEGKASKLFREDLYKKTNTMDLIKKRKVLDLGCGYGIDAYNFSKFASSVTGADLEYNNFWNKIKNKKIKFVKSASEKLPFDKGSFDAIYMKDLLHHVEDVEKTLEEVKRVSTKNANIIILEGNRYNPIFYFLVTKLRGHEHFRRGKFRKIILKYFPTAEFKSIEAYPPFFLNEKQYKIVILIEALINKINFLSPIFSYNVAIIKRK